MGEPFGGPAAERERDRGARLGARLGGGLRRGARQRDALEGEDGEQEQKAHHGVGSGAPLGRGVSIWIVRVGKANAMSRSANDGHEREVDRLLASM